VIWLLSGKGNSGIEREVNLILLCSIKAESVIRIISLVAIPQSREIQLITLSVIKLLCMQNGQEVIA
jgi:hypothetical protein